MKGQKTGGRSAGVPNRRTAAIQARILRDEALSVESTVEAIRRGQNYDARALFDRAGNLKAIHALTEEEAWAIAGFEVVIKNVEAGDGHTDKVAKVKLIDRRGYVELAAKHQGMLTDKVDVTVRNADAVIETLRQRHQRNKMPATSGGCRNK